MAAGEATYAETEVKLTLGEGASQQVLYHWTALLSTSAAGTTFQFTPIVNPGNLYLPSYQNVSTTDEAIYTADGLLVNINLGNQAAGTPLSLTFSTSIYTRDNAQDLPYTARATFGQTLQDFNQVPVGIDGLPFEISPAAATTPVPEPASSGLLAIGSLAALAWLRRARA